MQANQPRKPDGMTAVFDVARLRLVRDRVAAGDRTFDAALQALQVEADAWRDQGPFSVVKKLRIPPSGDQHDYLSYGPYWWPDPTKKDGLPYIRRDGEVNPECLGQEADWNSLVHFASGVETLALAAFFTGDDVLARRAALLLATWFLDPVTRMNPNLAYGQAIPGHCEGRGIGIIESRHFVQVINAIRLLDGSAALPTGQRQDLQAWFAAYLRWLLDSAHGRDECSQKNNHGTWYDVQVAAFALFTGELGLARVTLETAQARRLAAQVDPDGRQPRELARTKSFSYSVMNLQGLLALAEMGRPLGVDYWAFPSADQSRLRAAVDFLAAFADPAQAWPYPQLGGFDRLRLLPVLQAAAVLTGDPRYGVWRAQLPATTQTDRANLLWPLPAQSGI